MNDLAPWLNQVHVGECRELLRQMPEGSVQCCVGGGSPHE